MELILGALILLIYIYSIYHLFNLLTKVIGRKTNDLVKQVFPSWLIVAVSSYLIAIVTEGNLAVYLIFYGIFYFSLTVTLGLFILYFIIRLINPLIYIRITDKIKHNMNK